MPIIPKLNLNAALRFQAVELESASNDETTTNNQEIENVIEDDVESHHDEIDDIDRLGYSGDEFDLDDDEPQFKSPSPYLIKGHEPQVELSESDTAFKQPSQPTSPLSNVLSPNENTQFSDGDSFMSDHSKGSQESGPFNTIPPLHFVSDHSELAFVQSQPPSPPRKRRRAIKKLQGDPENMQLGDLLFYNPPKTIFQLENTPKIENDDLNNNPDNLNSDNQNSDNLSRRSLRSRSNSVVSEQSHDSASKNHDSIPPPTLTFDENGEIIHDEKEHKDDDNSAKNDGEQNNDDSEQVLTFDEKGNIVIKNPQALEIQSKIPEKPRANAERSMTTYNSFRRSTRSKGVWTTDETAVFYNALEIVGTDFSLMEAAFFKERGRTRKQLKQKFKREEKINRAYIDSILFKSLTNRTEAEGETPPQMFTQESKNFL